MTYISATVAISGGADPDFLEHTPALGCRLADQGAL